ncbi:hypothetical protein TREMEDRAFT_58594 [Tremella mesenterica DSM 1558]|uniref:uncharacterized protein n=1 Tax=Tremella mesenterica (strain ATCC 24925 / CBS 8224 / DSM 1558 / NBRC 9311 / NRRL Y-6157 / RJB 2259-6 / UBC 559-6) TaxID=578456 RepID=UPI0003F49D7B|nr:uncharacterized protein TREMEDRAFT_58594 [Tremella mesenterica DSM 1558]EIW72432.1 hypothetical protein TREMEDRAFT_58594 [Tremella mesenterica DSM 1558]
MTDAEKAPFFKPTVSQTGKLLCEQLKHPLRTFSNSDYTAELTGKMTEFIHYVNSAFENVPQEDMTVALSSGLQSAWYSHLFTRVETVIRTSNGQPSDFAQLASELAEFAAKNHNTFFSVQQTQTKKRRSRFKNLADWERTQKSKEEVTWDEARHYVESAIYDGSIACDRVGSYAYCSQG